MNDLELFESLLNTCTTDDLHSAISRVTQDMGYEHFIYGVQVNISLTRPYQFILSGYPRDWREHYEKAGYAHIDPTFRHCINEKRVIPVIWNSKVFSSRPAARLMSEAKDFRLASGASFAVHGRNGEAAMLSLASSRSSKQARTDIVGTLGKAQLLACYIHEAIQRLVLSKDALAIRNVSLSEREKECLRWAAEGKTSWEIGNIARISERTVIFHLQNASRKMGVSNRRHAVARAVSMGLVFS